MSRTVFFGLCAGLIGLGGSSNMAYAWGEDGHVIIGKIAEEYLTPEARNTVRDLLDNRSISDPRIAVWADSIRGSAALDRKYRNHRTWHYINIEITLKETDFAPAADQDHVLGAIEKFQKIILDPKIPKEDRKEALMFLLHFVEDLHQPLHCCFRNDDRGGNLQPVQSFGGVAEEKLNLHKVWDVNLVHAVRGKLTTADFARRLQNEISVAERQKWAEGKPRDWIWEAHQIAAKQAYQFTDGKAFAPRSEAGPELTEANYIEKNGKTVREQLKKAGVRLAKILNESCVEKK